MNSFDAVFFDYDGTLCDSMPTIFQGVSHVLTQSNLPTPTMEDFLRVFQIPYLPFYRKLGVTAPEEMIKEWYWGAVDHGSAALFPDAIMVLIALKQRGIVTGIVSANGPHIIKEKLSQEKVAHLFDFTECDALEKVASIQNALTTHSLNPQRTLFVGDISSDMRDAQCAGVVPIGITHTYPSKDILLEHGAACVITHLTELISLIDAGKH